MFSPIDVPIQTDYCDLNDAQKKKIVDYLVRWDSATAISHSLELAALDEWHTVPLSVSKGAIIKVDNICNQALLFIQWKIVIKEATETAEAECNKIPDDVPELKTELFKLFPECSQEAFDYVIDKCIEKKTVAWTLDSLKLYFANQE